MSNPTKLEAGVDLEATPASFKVQIRNNSRKRNKKHHWWIICRLCGTRSHVKQSHWKRAIHIANRHWIGKTHQRNITKGEKR